MLNVGNCYARGLIETRGFVGMEKISRLRIGTLRSLPNVLKISHRIIKHNRYRYNYKYSYGSRYIS